MRRTGNIDQGTSLVNFSSPTSYSTDAKATHDSENPALAQHTRLGTRAWFLNYLSLNRHLPRFFTRHSFGFQLWFSRCLKPRRKPHHQTHSAARAVDSALTEAAVENKTTASSERESTGLRGSSVTLFDAVQQSHVARMMMLLRRPQWPVTHLLWPLAFFIVQLRDAIAYSVRSEQRYGNTPGDLLLGTSPNQDSWSVHWGGDLPGAEPNPWGYWSVPFLLLSVSIFSKLISIFNTYRLREDRCEWNHSLRTNDNIGELFNTSDDQNQFWRDSTSWLFPGDALHLALLYAEFQILWDLDLSFQTRIELLNNIIHVGYRHFSIAQLEVLATLARIADEAHLDHLTALGLDPEIWSPIRDRALAALREFAKLQPDIAALRALAGDIPVEDTKAENATAEDFVDANNASAKNTIITANSLRPHPQSGLRVLYARFLLWSLHQSQDLGLSLLFWPMVLYANVYAQLRRYQLYYQKFKGYYDYKKAEAQCQQVFTYLSAIGDYICKLCPDWAKGNSDGLPLIPYSEISTPQQCVNGLFAQRRPPQVILSRIQQLVDRGGLQDVHFIDFTRQFWANWTRIDWQSLLHKLTSLRRLERLDLSNLLAERPNVDSKMQALAEFLRTVIVTQLILRNHNLSPAGLNQLLHGLFNSSVEFLDFSQQGWGNAGAVPLAVILPFLHRLKTLILSANQLADPGLRQLCSGLMNSSVSNLVLDDNPDIDEAIPTLLEVVRCGILKQLSLAGVPLAVMNMDPVGQCLRFLQRINLARCGLGDQHVFGLLPYLSQTSVQDYDLGHNLFTRQGMVLFFRNLRANITARMILDENMRLGENGIIAVAPFFVEKGIRQLSVAGLNLRMPGLQALLQNGRLFQFLNLAHNPLHEAVAELAKAIVAQVLPNLSHLNLTNIEMGASEGQQILLAVGFSNITHIILAQNRLISDDILTTIHGFQQLLVLDLRNNKLDVRVAQAFAQFFSPLRPLIQLLLDGNPLQRSGSVLAPALISEVPQPEQLGNDVMGLDLRRYLHQQAQSRTRLQLYGVNHANLDASDINFYCHTQEASRIPMSGLQLAGNGSPDPFICHSGQSPSARPWPIFRWLRIGIEQLPPIDFGHAMQGVLLIQLPNLQRQVQRLLLQGSQTPALLVDNSLSQVGEENTALALTNISAVPSTHTPARQILFVILVVGVALLYLLQRWLQTTARAEATPALQQLAPVVPAPTVSGNSGLMQKCYNVVGWMRAPQRRMVNALPAPVVPQLHSAQELRM